MEKWRSRKILRKQTTNCNVAFTQPAAEEYTDWEKESSAEMWISILMTMFRETEVAVFLKGNCH